MKKRCRQKYYSGICIKLMAVLLTFSMLLPFIRIIAYAAENDNKKTEKLTNAEVGKIITDFWNENEETAAGMAVSVFDKNGIIYSNYFGYADKEKKIKLEKNQVLDWGSISKTLIWVSVMQLKEQGVLDLEEDIRKYLPDGFLTHLHYDKPVTMLHLMNHTAGFDELLYDLETADEKEIIPLRNFLKKYQPNQSFEPGVISSYSNWGAALAAYIVESKTGVSYSDYVHKNIFERLGMRNSALLPDLSDNKTVAENRKILQGYTREGKSAGDCYRHIITYPAGMCTSDLNDLTIFARAISDPETTLFKNKDTYKELFTTTDYLGDTDIPVNCHGFWQSIYGENIIGHGGNTSSCSSQLQFDPTTGIGVVVMTNQIGEGNFCKKMPKLIMKAPEVRHSEGVNGNIMILPTVLSGPLKLASLDSTIEVNEEMFSGILCDRQTNDKVDRISTGGMDYLVMSDKDIAERYLTVALWIAALAFAVISLIVKLIRVVVRKTKKRENFIPLGRWSTVGSLLIISSVVLLAPCVYSLLDGTIWELEAYQIWSACFLVLSLIIAFVMIPGLIMLISNKMSVIRRIYNIAVFLMGSVVIYNIIYWQLYAFWLV